MVGSRFRVSLRSRASAPAWFWHVALENAGRDAVTVDLVYAQDLALADYGAVRLNEYYVSQYVDHTPLAHPGARRRARRAAEPLDRRPPSVGS